MFRRVFSFSAALPAVLLFTLVNVDVVSASPTPTPCAPPPTAAGGMSPQNLIQSTEPAITLFPFGSDERAAVLANSGYWATYDLVDAEFQLVTSGRFTPTGYNNVFDPVAVTQSTSGFIYVGGVAIRPFRQGGSILLWRSTDGVNWGSPITVADYPCTICPPDGLFPDKPWMDVAQSSGRLWMVWRPFGVPSEDPQRCVVTSLNGTDWSPSCVDPSGGAGVISVAVDGPHSAVAIFDEAGMLRFSRCTASGVTVTCSTKADIAPFREVNGGKLISGLRAGALFTIAGNDATGEVFAVWGEEFQPMGQQPVRARIVWTRKTGSTWPTPQPITNPTDDQVMPEIAYAADPGEWFVTLYQRRAFTHLFDVLAYQFRPQVAKWASLGLVSDPTFPVSANMTPRFFGDYSWAECPGFARPVGAPYACAVSFTGTNVEPFPNQPQIEVHAFPPAGVCVGDCDNNHIVFGTDITKGIIVLSGEQSVALCPAGDADVSNSITASEIMQSIQNLGLGCPNDPGLAAGGAAMGASTATIDIGEAQGQPGQHVSVPISVSGGMGAVAALQVDIIFNPAVVNVGDVATACVVGPGLAGRTLVASLPADPPPPTGKDRMRVFVGDLSHPISLMSDGVVVTCTFQIQAAAPVGTHALTAEGQEVADTMGSVLPSQVSSGSVQVCGGCGCS